MLTRHCDTCGSKLSDTEPFAVCAKCLFGTALIARTPSSPSADSSVPPDGKRFATIPGLAARPDFFQKYEILERVAQGGQGDIWKVWDFELRRCVAMKRLGEQALASESAIYRFLAEAQIASQLEHPGILPVFEVGLDPDGRPFYTTLLLPDTTLGNIWAGVHTAGSEWTLNRALELLVRVCDVMAHAHSRGVIHRDLKPANVLVGSFGDVRVIDWGSAHVLEYARKTFQNPFIPLNRQTIRTDRGEAMWAEPASPLSTAIAGHPVTTLFMPPEILRGEMEHLAPQTDVYSVGVMLYQLLAGRLPYSNPDGTLPEPAELREQILRQEPIPLRRLKRRISRDLTAICRKAMARSKADRYSTMGGLGDDLRAALELRPVQARKPGLLLRLQRKMQRNMAVTSLTATALLIAAIAFFVMRGIMAERDVAKQLTALRSAELASRSGRWRDALRLWEEAEAEGYSDTIYLGLRRAEAWTVLTSPRRSRAELEQLARRSDLGNRGGAVLLRVGEHELFDKDLFEQGVQTLRKALAGGLTGADEPFARGLLAESTPEALGLLRQALQIDPYHHSAHRHSLGLEYLLGRREEFAAHALIFNVLFPDDPAATFLEATQLASRGNAAEATVMLNRLKETMHPDLHKQLTAGFALLAAAAKHYETFLDKAPSSHLWDDQFSAHMALLWQARGSSEDHSTATRFPRLPCLHRFVEGAEALKALLLPGFTDPGVAIQKIKASWQRHPEALLPASAAALLENWRPAQGSGALPLLMAQSELFQMAADSTSLLPTIGKWARYHAARKYAELARSGQTNAPAMRAACLENIRQAAAVGPSAQACRAYFDMAFQLGDHDLARVLLTQWERLEPDNTRLNRSRIELEIAAGELTSALRRIDVLLAQQPADAEALRQRELVLTRLKQLLDSHQTRLPP